MGIVTNEATAARGVAVLQDLPGDEDAPGRAWQGILPSRRATWVLSVVLFATMLVQGMVNPIAALIDGNYSWSNPIPFERSSPHRPPHSSWRPDGRFWPHSPRWPAT